MKSFSVALWACWNTLFPAQRALYTRYTLTSAEISIIPEFQEKIQMLGIAPLFHANKARVVNRKTGSDILFSGIKTSTGNQTAKLKSIPGLNIFIVDEAEEFTSETDFDTIDESIRVKEADNRVIIIMNPTTEEHWVYKRFILGHEKYVEIDGHKVAISTHPDVYHIHTTYLDNLKNLSESFLEQARKIRIDNPLKYARRYIGAWQNRAEGAIYENWTEGEFDDSLPFIYGFDEGYYPDPSALVKVAVDNRRKLIYLKEMFYEQRLATPMIIERLKLHCAFWDMIIADEKGRLIYEIKDAGFNIEKAFKYPGSVKDGIMKIEDYQIVVDPGSYNLKIELRNYVWNDKRASIPADGYDHAMDAFRYAFEFLDSGQTSLPRRAN